MADDVTLPDYLRGFDEDTARWIMAQVDASPPMSKETRRALLDLSANEASSRLRKSA